MYDEGAASEIEEISVTKNGKKIKLHYETYGDDRSALRYPMAVSLAIEDFTALFGLDYEIDEQNGCVYFTKG